AEPEVVLDVQTENLLANAPVRTFTGYGGAEQRRHVCQKVLDRIELPVSKRVMSDVDVIANGLDAESGPDIVAPLDPGQVVGHLGRSVPKAVTPRGADAAGRIRREL